MSILTSNKLLFVIAAAFVIFTISPFAALAAGPVFIDANANGVLDSGELSFATIQTAITAAAVGNTVVVTAGTYTGAVNDTKGVTLRASGAVTIVGLVTLNASGSKIYGFDVTNPTGNFGILINGVGNTEASNNTVHHVGTGAVAGTNYGIFFQDKNLVDADTIKIQNNTISNIGTITNGTNGGIGVGDSTGNSNLTGVLITGNIISSIAANTTPISPGKGAYGIIVNHALHNLVSNMGSTSGVLITGNTISNLNGRWAHGIGLEGNTPNAVVTGNTVSHLISSSVPSDATAVVFQDNASAASVTVHNNSFDIASMSLGVANLVPLVTADATLNYWGTSGITTGQFFGLVNFAPWYLDQGMTTLSSIIIGTTVNITSGNLDVQETSDGGVSLPAGTSNVVLGDTSVLNLASSTNAVSGGTVVIAGTTTTLSSVTSGSLVGVNLSTPQIIGGQSVVVGEAVQLSSGLGGVPTILTNSTIGSASISIPDDTTILAPSGWNGAIAPPRTASTSGDTAPAGFSVSSAVDVGSSNVILLFDKPVLVTLSGVTGSIGYRPTGSTVWTQITATCSGGYATPTLSAAAFPGECSVSDGTDTKILTYHLTAFGGLNVIPPPAPPASSPTVSTGVSASLVPLIGVIKIPSPLALPAGPGSVTYTFTVWNVGGQQALTSISLTDDKCAPITFISGDTNLNGKLDPDERWMYTCSTTLSQTTTNTAVATGHSDEGANQVAIATALATVAVGPLFPNTGGLPPLINIVEVPSRLAPFPFGGGPVVYAYAVTNPGVVPMHNVLITDDHCDLIFGPLAGDVNGNGLLDAGETWGYSCRAQVSVSTRNIATAEGDANGFTAFGYAFATVLVGGPGLPAMGIAPQMGAITTNLYQGNSGSSVTALQQFLIAQQKGPAAQALAANGATTYFGVLTRAALVEFQARVGISPAFGNFGAITRAYISAHY